MTAYTSIGDIHYSFHHEHMEKDMIEVGGRWVKAFTRCTLQLADGTAIWGYAWCSAEDDFNKETGRKVALKRALEVGRLDRSVRREIWMSYHSRKLSGVSPLVNYWMAQGGWNCHEAAI